MFVTWFYSQEITGFAMKGIQAVSQQRFRRARRRGKDNIFTYELAALVQQASGELQSHILAPDYARSLVKEQTPMQRTSPIWVASS